MISLLALNVNTPWRKIAPHSALVIFLRKVNPRHKNRDGVLLCYVGLPPRSARCFSSCQRVYRITCQYRCQFSKVCSKPLATYVYYTFLHSNSQASVVQATKHHCHFVAFVFDPGTDLFVDL